MAGFTNTAASCVLLLVYLFERSVCEKLNVAGEELYPWFEYNDTDVTNDVTASPGGNANIVLLDDLEESLFIKETKNACAMDIFRVLLNVDESWAQQMLDAAAKPPSGIMDLNVNWLGNFYECQNVRAPPTNGSIGFTGRYCTVTLSIRSSIMSSLNTTGLPLNTGICVPSTCTAEDLTNLMNITLALTLSSMRNHSLSSSMLRVAGVSCRLEKSFDAAAIATLFVLSVFLFLMVAGTSITAAEKYSWYTWIPGVYGKSSVVYTNLEGAEENEKNIQEVPPARESTLKQFLKCFCIITNGSKMFSTNGRGDLGCVHGIRFLSMTWVILGHTYASIAVLGFTGDAREIFHAIDNWPFQAVMQGAFSVDSFFLLSGFLLTYLFLKEATKTDGKISWGLYYAHRYWRLTPVYAVVLAFSTALTVYVADGPLWPNESTDINCRKSWWWNLLYINNFQTETEACMGWSWYLANDMQFYVISPIFLYVLWRWPKVGLPLISGALISSWIATATISYHYDIIAGFAIFNTNDNFQNAQDRNQDYQQKIYGKPYTRIGPYLIGMLLGYAVTQQLNHKKPLPKVGMLVGWVLAAAAGLGIVYGFYHCQPDRILSAFYNALSRSIFAAALAWIIFACLAGYGGLVNTILSWSFLVPLSRLTYCAYLVHPIIMGSFLQSIRSSIQATHIVMVTLFLGFVIMSYTTALVCSLAFESSMMAVEKLVLSKFRKPIQSP